MIRVTVTNHSEHDVVVYDGESEHQIAPGEFVVVGGIGIVIRDPSRPVVTRTKGKAKESEQ